jgi:hypothetical protein
MAVIFGNSYYGGIDHDQQIVSMGVKDEGSPLVAIGNSLTDGIEPPNPNHSFGKACASTCGSRIVVEVHPDPNNLYESYLAFYDTETLQPVGLGTTNPGYNSVIRYESSPDAPNPALTNAPTGIIQPSDQVITFGYSGNGLDSGSATTPSGTNANYNTTFYQLLQGTLSPSNFHRITPVDQGPAYTLTTPESLGDWAWFTTPWYIPHGYVDWKSIGDYVYTVGNLKYAPMPYETVVHSPVPLRDKIAAIVEYKVPWKTSSAAVNYINPSSSTLSNITSHGHGRYNGATSTGHMGVVCLGVFGLDGEVIAIHEILFKAPSKMHLSSDWWNVQNTNDLTSRTDNFPTVRTAMVSMGEYGAIKLSAHNGMVAIGCTFNQAHMYDTGTFDIYGPGDGIYLFRMGDSRQSGPKYFTNMRLPAGSYMDFFPEHLDMGSNYLVATGVPRGTGATSTLFDQSTGQRESTHFEIRPTVPRQHPDVSLDLIGYGSYDYYMVSSRTSNTPNNAPFFTGINTSPHAAEPYIRLYDLNGLLQAHIGKGSYTDKLSFDSNDTGYPIVNYDTSVKHDSSTSNKTINYGGLSSVSLGSGKLVVGISSANSEGWGLVDIYHLKSTSNIMPNMNAVSDEAIFGFSKRMVMDDNLYTGSRKYSIDSGTIPGVEPDQMGQNVLISGQRIVIGSADGNTLFNDGNSLNIQYSNSGKVEVTNFDIPAYDEPYFSIFTGSRFGDTQYIVDDNTSHQYLFDSKGILAGYATTDSKIEAKDFRSGVLIIGTEIGKTPARMKVLLTPPQDTVLDVLGEK